MDIFDAFRQQKKMHYYEYYRGRWNLNLVVNSSYAKAAHYFDLNRGIDATA